MGDYWDSVDVKSYLGADLQGMIDEIETNGIIYESQFSSYTNMPHKRLVPQIIDLLEDATGLQNILYGYDNHLCMGFIYDRDRYSNEEAIKLSQTYQKSIGNDINN